ncbi:FeoB-associated Cys-rich membrane protein [uncultured Olleya sp.]|uniref:FeoB-associated Cys-rich membrane protein n=1 Tax=uncultured Olleya sp. TaxID=757243 RepID=UPI0025976DF4|nr:FeoB-associated Cys-rich membrane protein [uncultured Olleya sp.]
MKKEIHYKTVTSIKTIGFCLVAIAILFLPTSSFGQVKTSIDSTSIKIGAQVTYKIEVETDTANSVIFPVGQSFMPLEMIEAYKTDTTKQDAKYKLIKKYGLTQFDSGQYTIPKQKVIIAGKQYMTDSLLVTVNEIQVDTTKQNLYDIKPMIAVEKPASNWWIYVLVGLVIAALVGFLIYWFVWRKKPLTEEEQIALLPPYDRAKLALQKLDESNYLIQNNYKDYYSELTFAIRRYLDEKVYDKALESTTDQLITRLEVLSDGSQIELSKEDIKKLETVLKRADLVKFAKSAPDVELAKIDRTVIDQEIDQVKEALPEPTEEEKLLDLEYKKKQERKDFRQKVWVTIAAIVFMLGLTFAAFSYRYGFTYVVDTIFQKDTKQLLEGSWVDSDYGFPPITLSTPEVLKREETPIPDELKDKIKVSSFGFELENKFTIETVTTTFVKSPTDENTPSAEDNLLQAIEANLKAIEAQGGRNIISNKDKFKTPNEAEGVKTTGTLEYPIDDDKEDYVNGQFVILSFANKQVMQQIVITYLKDDIYLDQVVERILDSVELIQKEK